MLLLMVVNFVERQYCLTSYPSENSISIVRHLCHKFPVNDLLSNVMNLYDLQKNMAGGNFKPLRTSEASGYAAILHEKMGESFNCKVEAYILILTKKKKPQEGLSDEEPASGEIWEGLQLILNKAEYNKRFFNINVQFSGNTTNNK